MALQSDSTLDLVGRSTGAPLGAALPAPLDPEPKGVHAASLDLRIEKETTEILEQVARIAQQHALVNKDPCKQGNQEMKQTVEPLTQSAREATQTTELTPPTDLKRCHQTLLEEIDVVSTLPASSSNTCSRVDASSQGLEYNVDVQRLKAALKMDPHRFWREAQEKEREEKEQEKEREDTDWSSYPNCAQCNGAFFGRRSTVFACPRRCDSSLLFHNDCVPRHIALAHADAPQATAAGGCLAPLQK